MASMVEIGIGTVPVGHIAGECYVADDQILTNSDINTWRDRLTHQLVFQIRMRLAAKESVLKTTIVTYPADWWQHFKQRWFPSWAKKMWPVIMTTQQIPVSIMRVCPHVKIREGATHLNWVTGITQP